MDMTRSRAARLGVAVLSAAVLAGPPAGAAVRLATFNVFNYLVTDRRVDDRFRPEYPKPEREKAAVRTAIRAVAPDVLALQEMGPAPFLEELRQDLAREGLAFPHHQLLEAADPDRHVAVLSRLPFAAVTPHTDLAFDYFGASTPVKRGLLEIRFGEGEAAWTLFVVHLKSRMTNRADDPMSAERRLREARAVRDRILERFTQSAGARLVVMGDFNDTKDSRPVGAFLRRGSRSLLHFVPAADSRGEAWTHRYAPADAFSRVDFILVSPSLRAAVVGGRGVVHDGEGALGGSDHRLVYCDLEPGADP